MSTTTSTTTVPGQQKQVGTFTRVMRVLYVVFAWLLALCILIQVFLAGVLATWGICRKKGGVHLFSTLLNLLI